MIKKIPSCFEAKSIILPYCKFCFLMPFQNVSPTVDGMLGGFAFVSPVDIDGSTEFIKEFLEVSILMPNGPSC